MLLGFGFAAYLSVVSLQRGGAELVGRVLCGSDSRRLWGAHLGCHDEVDDGFGGSGATLASILASTEGLCGLGGRCALGVGFAPCFWAFLRERTSAPTIAMTMGWERLWCYVGLVSCFSRGCGQSGLEVRLWGGVRGVPVGIPMLESTRRLSR